MLHDITLYELKWENLGIKWVLKVSRFQIKSRMYLNLWFH